MHVRKRRSVGQRVEQIAMTLLLGETGDDAGHGPVDRHIQRPAHGIPCPRGVQLRPVHGVVNDFDLCRIGVHLADVEVANGFG